MLQPREAVAEVRSELGELVPFPVATGDVEDSRTKIEELDYERVAAEIFGLKPDIGESRRYADKLFWLISVWLGTVMLALFTNGCEMKRSFLGNTFEFSLKRLDSEVLIALIGGTTATVLGLFVIVANYLFPKRDKC
jgi:hypothetical protein